MYVSGCNADIDNALWPVSMMVRMPGRRYLSGSRYSAQLLVPLTGTLYVRPRGVDRWRECAGALVPAGASLDVDGPAGPVVLGLLDPRMNLAAFGERGDSFVVPSDVVFERWRRMLVEDGPADSSRVQTWIQSEFNAVQRRVHPRVLRVVRYLVNANLDGRHTSLACLAGIAQLSPSRLMHVFTESLGIPLRPYLLCLRVRCAVAAMASGQTVTQAAYAIGFADAAHLARTFRSVLGITPRQLVPLGGHEPGANNDLAERCRLRSRTTRPRESLDVPSR